MTPIRAGRAVLVGLAVIPLAIVAAPAADGPVATSLSGSISPSHVGRPSGGVGTKVVLRIRTVFDHPAESSLRLQKVVYKLPPGAVANGRLFPACEVAALIRARGRLSVCPRGSKIGGGVATGTAVDIGVTSSGRLTLFNGPGGRSLTLNVSITSPAHINMSVAVPLRRTRGRYGYVTTAVIPAQLQTILDGPIVVRSIDLHTGATVLAGGVRRGYIEAFRCPRSGRVPLHGDFSFSEGVTAAADATIACS